MGHSKIVTIGPLFILSGVFLAVVVVIAKAPSLTSPRPRPIRPCGPNLDVPTSLPMRSNLSVPVLYTAEIPFKMRCTYDAKALISQVVMPNKFAWQAWIFQLLSD